MISSRRKGSRPRGVRSTDAEKDKPPTCRGLSDRLAAYSAEKWGFETCISAWLLATVQAEVKSVTHDLETQNSYPQKWIEAEPHSQERIIEHLSPQERIGEKLA